MSTRDRSDFQHDVLSNRQLSAARLDPIDIREMLAQLWMGKWLISGVTLLMTVVTTYYAFSVAQPRYAAKVSLYVSQSESSPLNAPTRLNLNSEIALIRSRVLLDQVIDQLDLQDDPEFNRYLTPVSPWSPSGLRAQIRTALTGQQPAMPDAPMVSKKTFENLANVVSATADENSAVITIIASSRYDQKAIQIANTVAATYLHDQVEAASLASQAQIDWLTAQVIEYQTELSQKEAAMTDLASATRPTDQATFDDLNRQALDTDKRLRDAQSTLADLRSPDGVFTSATLVSNTRRIEGQISALQDVRANLAEQLAQQSAGLIKLNQLRREANATRVLYETFLTHLQEAKLQGGVQTIQSRILNPAGPAYFVGTRKTFLIGVGALVGVVLGMSWVFLRDAFRSGFRKPSTLRDATNLPVMGQLPRLPLRNPGQLLDILSRPACSTIHHSATSLRTALLFRDTKEPPHTVLCTSSVAEERQELLSIILAQAFANLGKSVLLLNAEKGPDSIARYLPGLSTNSLEQVIDGKTPLAHAIHRDPRWQVDVLSGNADNSSEIFSSAAFSNFAHRLRERYDFIVVNAPPVLHSANATILAQQSDAVLYAVRAAHTSLDLIQAGQYALETVQAPITSLVLTQLEQNRDWSRSTDRGLNAAMAGSY